MSETNFDPQLFQHAIQHLLNDSRRNVEPFIVPESVLDIIHEGLELALLDPDALSDFVRYLDSINTPRFFRPHDLDSSGKLEAVIESGLGCLTPNELAVLALSPFQLRDIQEALDERGLSDYWWSVATRSQPNEPPAIVEPRQEQVRAYESPALTIALDNPPTEPAASGQPDLSEHWNEERSLGDAEFLAIHDIGRADRAKATTVIVSFHLFHDRESGILEVHLSQPLPLSGPATCSAKLLNVDKRVPQDDQGKELPNASTTARDGRLQFIGIGSLLSEVHWLEIEYHHASRFHLRLRTPLSFPKQQGNT